MSHKSRFHSATYEEQKTILLKKWISSDGTPSSTPTLPCNLPTPATAESQLMETTVSDHSRTSHCHNTRCTTVPAYWPICVARQPRLSEWEQ